MKKLHWAAGAIAVLVLGGASVYAYTSVSNHSASDNKVLTKQKSAATSKSNVTSASSISSESNISDVSSYASSKAAESVESDKAFSPAGEMSEAAASYSSVMKSDSGVAITADMVAEARNQLKQQGIETGAFPDQNIAEVINKANNESVDYATTIKELFPDYFKN